MMMQQEERTVCFDDELGIEAYRFKGIMQKFPNHFHEYYVVGFIESGRRYLSCKNKEYVIGTGDILLFNPGDNLVKNLARENFKMEVFRTVFY
ncbi:MAG: AraC family ligand binding domain-containing protein [Acidaminococcaceae bacterium]